MARIFISYSRTNSDQLQTIVGELSEVFGADGIFYDTHNTGGKPWWDNILEQIETALVFVYLISNESLASYSCRAEYLEAMRRGKHVVLIDITDDIDLEYTDPPIAYILNKLHRLKYTQTGAIIRAITEGLSRSNANYYKRQIQEISAGDITGQNVNLGGSQTYNISYVMQSPSPVNEPAPGTSVELHPEQPSEKQWWKKPEFIVGAILIPILAAVIGGLIQNPSFFGLDSNDSSTLEPTISVATRFTHTPTQAATNTPNTPVATSTREPSITPLPTTGIPTSTNTSMPPTATPTLIAGITAEQFAELGVWSNDIWEPFITERNFDGVNMVLVPSGCFMMGNDEGREDERPEHRICFEDPFWIDKTEVSRAAFGPYYTESENISSDPNQPQISVLWYRAEDHCIARGARLPTEAEWEYAARGPDNLLYPWGTGFVADYVIYRDNFDGRAAPVDSLPSGASWVGSLHMAGNAAEWTSTQYRNFPYPYNSQDGREDGDRRRGDMTRVLRGGSWVSTSEGVATTTRGSTTQGGASDIQGFRCVRDYED